MLIGGPRSLNVYLMEILFSLYDKTPTFFLSVFLLEDYIHSYLLTNPRIWLHPSFPP